MPVKKITRRKTRWTHKRSTVKKTVRRQSSRSRRMVRGGTYGRPTKVGDTLKWKNPRTEYDRQQRYQVSKWQFPPNDHVTVDGMGHTGLRYPKDELVHTHAPHGVTPEHLDGKRAKMHAKTLEPSLVRGQRLRKSMKEKALHWLSKILVPGSKAANRAKANFDALA